MGRSSSSIPEPLSDTLSALMPPSRRLTWIRVAPASMAFSSCAISRTKSARTDQLLDAVRWALDDFARRDTVHDLLVQPADALEGPRVDVLDIHLEAVGSAERGRASGQHARTQSRPQLSLTRCTALKDGAESTEEDALQNLAT